MTHTFNIDKGSIRLVASHKGKQYKRCTGLTIDPALWDRGAKSLRSKCKDREVYEKLRLVHLRCSEKEGWAETEDDVQRAMAFAVTGDMPPKGSPRRPLS